MTFETMATQSALIAGFSYDGLTSKLANNVNFALSFGYLGMTTIAMAAGLLSITIATFVMGFLI